MENFKAKGENITKKEKRQRYIVVTGGVLSSLGKGLTTASIGSLLEAQGYTVNFIKIDPYINVDAGTMNPKEHGEVYVTEDGFETDLDLGNYERFTGSFTATKKSSITTGQIYQSVITKERSGFYKGRCVEFQHLEEEVIEKIKSLEGDFVLVEVGGTVGSEDLQSPFLNAISLMAYQGEPVKNVHVTLAVDLGEGPKTKPAQASLQALRQYAISHDFVVVRSELPLDDERKNKISRNSRVRLEHVISAYNESILYKIPLNFRDQELDSRMLNEFGLPYRRSNIIKPWEDLIERIKTLDKTLEIALIEKYSKHGDSKIPDTYKSVLESIKVAAWHLGYHANVSLVESEKYEKNPELVKELKKFHGIIVPGGFGERGIEGKIKAIEYCRNEKVPFLGLCLGLQLAVVEYARNVCGKKGANSTEFNKETKHPVIDILPEQKEKLKKKDFGGSMRLGAQDAELKPGTLVWEAYGKKEKISERHRHRYEVNNAYKGELMDKGLVVSGINPQKNLVEFIELPGEKHPFFAATQAHPEFQSRFLKPSPLFTAFIKAAAKQ